MKGPSRAAAGRLPVPALDAPVGDVLAQLRAAADGLPQEEAQRRLRLHGPNELPRVKPRGWGAILLRQVKDVMVAVLAAALVLSLLLGHAVEAAAIGAIGTFTVVLGFVQELRATRAVEALHRLSAPRANVLRSGTVESLATQDVVPGDVIVLAQGDIVPADARLLEAVELQVAEASLTGESATVPKAAGVAMHAAQPLGDRAGSVHASTVVTSGRARAVVTATGPDTELGRIGKLLEGVRPEATPLQRQLARLARLLLWIGCGAVALIVALGLVRGHAPADMLLFGMAVAVAVVPEALPAVVTISLAIGAQRMARRNALIRRLPTVETLGGTTVICSDKTGTLTVGQMAVARVAVPGTVHDVAANGYEPRGAIVPAPGDGLRELALAGALCNDAHLVAQERGWQVRGDPTEGALLVLARKLGIDEAQAQASHPRRGEVPFSSERKLMTTLHDRSAGRVAYAKGAPEAVFRIVSHVWSPAGPRPFVRTEWEAVADRLAADGLRVLALARREASRATEAEAAMALLGLVGMRDAPRAEAKASIEVCRAAGIRAVMITGDHPGTAAAVARELGIPGHDRVATGAELEEWTDEQVLRNVEEVGVYARVAPAHKLRIVSGLQRRGHVVAMTGDGVNDAPALRKADIGIAMGITGTDVSKEAAGMMLADDDFATIVAAVEEGRAIFDNIRKYLTFLLSTNLGEVLLFALTMALGLPLPLAAVQILYVNLASDGLPALALAVEPHEDDLMRRRPRGLARPILERGDLAFMLVAGLLSAGANLGVFLWARGRGLPLQESMTLVFASLVLIQLAKAYVFRAPGRPITDRPFANRWLNWAILWEVALLLLLVYVPFFEGVFGTRPLHAMDWAGILASVALVVLVLEAIKWALRLRAAPRSGAGAMA